MPRRAIRVARAKALQAWKVRSGEHRLLRRYIRSVRGDLYLEVPIGGPGGAGNWPAGCSTRRLDGVRLSAHSRAPRVHWFAPNKQDFLQQIHRTRVELIEVKAWLNRYVIGQAIAGRRMFERQYKVRPSRVVILCRRGRGDGALEWVCKRERIVVRKL